MKRLNMTRAATVSLAAALMAATLALAQPGAEDAIERGRELTEAFYAGDLAPIAEAFSDELSDGIGGAEGLAAFREQVLAQLGEEVQVLDERVDELPGIGTYTRLARFERFGGPVMVQWALGEEGAIVGFLVQALPTSEPAPSSYLEHETRADLRLPFDGEWFVFWGGRTVEENYHAASRDQRFALDLVVVRDGSTHAGDGAANEDYYCWGQPVLAPGDGVVVAAVDGEPDNVPGRFGDERPLGNHVIIDHGTGEYSFLAHLREGSVRVRAGQRVAAGEQVGECGNSGRSSEPHLHFHLQDSPEFGMGEGMPAQFQRYLADGVPVARGEPVRGQVVAPRQ